MHYEYVITMTFESGIVRFLDRFTNKKSAVKKLEKYINDFGGWLADFDIMKKVKSK